MRQSSTKYQSKNNSAVHHMVFKDWTTHTIKQSIKSPKIYEVKLLIKTKNPPNLFKECKQIKINIKTIEIHVSLLVSILMHFKSAPGMLKFQP